MAARLQKDGEVARRELVRKLEEMHEQSWASITKYVTSRFNTWSVTTEELGDQTILPTLLPWLDKCLSDSTWSRSDEEEGYILFISLPTCGVAPAKKLGYFIQLATTFLATHRKNAVCVLLYPNRAKDKSGVKQESPGETFNFWFMSTLSTVARKRQILVHTILKIIAWRGKIRRKMTTSGSQWTT